MEKELVFVQSKEYIYTKKVYPVMRLGDILVHCLHYKSAEDAISNWNRRRLKIDLYPGQTWFWEALNTNASNESNCLNYNIIDLLNNKKAERFTRIEK